MKNYTSVLNQLESAGLDLSRTMPPGNGGLLIGYHKPVRTRMIEGDREYRGWYSLHEVPAKEGGTLIIGTYGVWRGNDNGAQKILIDRKAFDPAQAAANKAKIAQDIKAAAATREAIALDAAHRAAKVWREYRPGGGQSEYLARKCVQAHGMRWSNTEPGTCAIPIRDGKGKVWGLQILRGKNRRPGLLEKEYFPRGLAKQGHYHQIGTIGDSVIIAEGYATAATIHECTGLPVVVAFDAGNLKPVAESIRKSYKRVRILLAADDDYLTEGNPGCKAAKEAALAVDGDWCKPIFTVDRQNKKLTDFNDLYMLEGPQAVQNSIQAAVARLPSSARSALLAAAAATQGGGDGGDAKKTGTYPEARSILSVEEIVERYIWIDATKSGIVWDGWKRDLCDFGKVTDQLPARVRRDDIKDHPLWQSRACHIEHVGFDPSGNDPEVRLNTWWGWPMQPAPGECSGILDHLWWLTSEETNPDVHRQSYDYLLWWMAYPLQHPGAKHTAAVIMHGPQGTGKSIIFQRVLAKIYGRGKLPKFNYSVILDQKALQDNFNATWENKLFVLTEEAVTSSDKWQLKNELKELVTGEQIRIRKVFTDAYYQKNQLNLAFLSNEDQPLPLDNSDRRHLVIYTPAKRDLDYYTALLDEIDNGGIEAFYDYLMRLDLSKFRIGQTPPETEAKRRLVELSKSSELRFIDEWTAGHTEWPVTPCQTDHLYSAYKIWCHRNGEKFPRPSNYFWAPILRPENKWEKRRARIWDNTHYTGDTKQTSVQIPPSAILETHKTAQPVDKTVQQWLTDCCIQFAAVIEGYQ